MSSDNTLTVIYSKGGHRFEIFVDLDKYPEFLKGHKKIKEVCLSDVISNESKKNLSESTYMTIFGTSDVWKYRHNCKKWRASVYCPAKKKNDRGEKKADSGIYCQNVC